MVTRIMFDVIICIFAVVISTKVVGAFFDNYNVEITSDSPVVVGGTVHFTAKLSDLDGNPVSGSFLYEWEDDAIPRHRESHKSTSATDTWNTTYSSKFYPSGKYLVQVTVKKFLFVVYEEVTSQRAYFYLTRNLNGQMEIIQENKTINSLYISNAKPVTHKIILSPPDAEYLNNSATEVLTYWFVDCTYYGPTNDYTFHFNFTEPEKQHSIEAWVIAHTDSDPPHLSTTTESPSNTTNITLNTHNDSLVNKSISDSENLLISTNNTDKNSSVQIEGLVSYNSSSNFPYGCLKFSSSEKDSNTYGYFSRNITVKAPVSNVTITGNNWLQHGDILSLRVKCNGSQMFNYCVHWPKGHYNITGNETCLNPDTSEKCEFPIRHYFLHSNIYSVVIVIYNDVGKVVTPVTVTVYKVNKQAQLSVIIVPVTFSLVAVVLIIFGFAYYLQNRSRFIVEVAEFNFNRQYTDMEYKTFGERLKESISSALTRTPIPNSSERSVWPPGQKYGSLT